MTERPILLFPQATVVGRAERGGQVEAYAMERADLDIGSYPWCCSRCGDTLSSLGRAMCHQEARL